MVITIKNDSDLFNDNQINNIKFENDKTGEQQ